LAGALGSARRLINLNSAKEIDEVLVPGKGVVDYNVQVRVKSDGSGVELSNVKMSMNSVR